MSGRFTFLLMVLGALFLSWLPFLHWPFQWLQTYYHEISHGLAALITDGRIVRIELNINGSGVCYTQGGSRFLISLAGYLGAVFWGLLIYFSTLVRSPRVFQAMMLLTGILLLVTLGLWARDAVTIGVLMVLLGLVVLQWRLKSIQLTRLAFQFVGIYILLDAIKAPLNLIDGRHRGDGAALSDLTGLPEFVWIIVWFSVALVGLYYGWKYSVAGQTGYRSPIP